MSHRHTELRVFSHRSDGHGTGSHSIKHYKTASHNITLHHNASHSITMHHTSSHSITMHHTPSQCITQYHTASHSITMHHARLTGLPRLTGLACLLHKLYVFSTLRLSPLWRDIAFCKRVSPFCRYEKRHEIVSFRQLGIKLHTHGILY